MFRKNWENNSALATYILDLYPCLFNNNAVLSPWRTPSCGLLFTWVLGKGLSVALKRILTGAWLIFGIWFRHGPKALCTGRAAAKLHRWNVDLARKNSFELAILKINYSFMCGDTNKNKTKNKEEEEVIYRISAFFYWINILSGSWFVLRIRLRHPPIIISTWRPSTELDRPNTLLVR